MGRHEMQGNPGDARGKNGERYKTYDLTGQTLHAEFLSPEVEIFVLCTLSQLHITRMAARPRHYLPDPLQRTTTPNTKTPERTLQLRSLYPARALGMSRHEWANFFP